MIMRTASQHVLLQDTSPSTSELLLALPASHPKPLMTWPTSYAAPIENSYCWGPPLDKGTYVLLPQRSAQQLLWGNLDLWQQYRLIYSPPHLHQYPVLPIPLHSTHLHLIQSPPLFLPYLCADVPAPMGIWPSRYPSHWLAYCNCQWMLFYSSHKPACWCNASDADGWGGQDWAITMIQATILFPLSWQYKSHWL